MARKVIVLIICFVLTVCLFDCDEHNHQYKDGEEIIAWMNTVGPYHNRQENYPYFSLPFCAGGRKEISHRHETISEHLLGMELEYSGLEIKFKNDVTNTNFCSIASTPDQLRQFIDAINRDYWYEMLIDDLPAYSEVGFLEHENGVYNLYTHKLISLSYNNDRIIEFNLTVANPQPLIFGSEIWFSYKVTWSKSNLNYDQRFSKYLDTKFFGHQIHWFSILNSFMMVQFLVCFVFMILSRTLRHDFARYGFVNDGDVNSLNTEPRSDYERSIVEEYGWKQVQGDVFRPPRKAILLASLLGTGLHISTCLLLLIIVTIIGRLYTKLSSMIGAGIFLYAILSPINGFFGASYYSQWNGKNWIKQMITGILLFPMLFAIAGFSINLIAVCSGNTRAIPLLTILSLIATMCLIVAPLNLVGTLFGRATSGTIVDTRILKFNAIPRPVPEKPWYLRTFTMNILGGILPFGSIFIEMYFIFSSFWAYTIYYVYGFMLLVFIMLVIVTSCVAVVSTYFLLNAEDHYWHWSSFMVGASVSIYVYIYSIYYFYSRTRMSGLFQVTFYFSYMALFCNILGIMCGTFGYLGANAFVYRIYSVVKID